MNEKKEEIAAWHAFDLEEVRDLLAEAMALGLPVVHFGVYGPGRFSWTDGGGNATATVHTTLEAFLERYKGQQVSVHAYSYSETLQVREGRIKVTAERARTIFPEKHAEVTL